MTSSEKSRAYSKGGYRPPRRESIDDHLAVIQARTEWLKIAKSEDLASVAFVRDLIHERIIDGPRPCKKARGAGRGQRFLPRDYHDLLVVLQLKSRGVVHRSAWICALWLRGRTYSLPSVRDAMVTELDRLRKTSMADFAPTGRFCETFAKKYDKRVRQRPDGQMFPELVDFFEPIAALMIRPNAISEIDPNLDRMAVEMKQMTGLSSEVVRPMLSSLVRAMKEQRDLSAEEGQHLTDLLAAIPVPGLADAMVGFAQSPEAQNLENNLTGLLDDGVGGSNLIEAVKQSSDEVLLKARVLFGKMRSGRARPILLNAMAEADPVQAAYLQVMAASFDGQRAVSGAQPAFAVQIFASWVLDMVEPTTHSRSHEVNANDVLSALRIDDP